MTCATTYKLCAATELAHIPGIERHPDSSLSDRAFQELAVVSREVVHAVLRSRVMGAVPPMPESGYGPEAAQNFSSGPPQKSL